MVLGCHCDRKSVIYVPLQDCESNCAQPHRTRCQQFSNGKIRTTSRIPENFPSTSIGTAHSLDSIWLSSPHQFAV